MKYKDSTYIMKNEQPRDPRGCVMSASLIAGIVITVILALCFSGCKTPQPLVQIQREYVHDTTLLHDSVYTDVWHTVVQRGDTVYKTDSVFLYRYKYLDKVQRVEIRDSIPYKVEVQVPVRQRNWYDRATSWGFWLLFVAFLLAVAWKIAKWYLTHKI